MRKHRRLQDAYRFRGFRPVSIVRGIFGDPKARILRLERREKKLCVVPVTCSPGFKPIANGDFRGYEGQNGKRC